MKSIVLFVRDFFLFLKSFLKFLSTILENGRSNEKLQCYESGMFPVASQVLGLLVQIQTTENYILLITFYSNDVLKDLFAD